VGGNWVLCGSNPYPVPDNADSAAAFDCDGRIESFVDGIVRALFPGSPAPASEQLISDLEARLLDATQDDVARLEALTRLAGLAGRGGARRLSATSIVGAVTLQTLSDERVVRRGVWQTIAGTKDPYVTEPLVASLRTDADPSVRAAAARALASFADDRDVRAALQAAAGDPSESVRRAAQAALKTVADRQQEALESLTDNSLPESDRLFPFNAIWYDPELLPINAGIAAALLDMARNSMDPAIRSNAWTALTADDYFRDASVLLEALRTDPDDSVRGLLVNLLVQYASDPAVIDALDAIAVKEPSRSLRATAAQALERARTSVR
jgi:HEAT repeat protein